MSDTAKLTILQEFNRLLAAVTADDLAHPPSPSPRHTSDRVVGEADDNLKRIHVVATRLEKLVQPMSAELKRVKGEIEKRYRRMTTLTQIREYFGGEEFAQIAASGDEIDRRMRPLHEMYSFARMVFSAEAARLYPELRCKEIRVDDLWHLRYSEQPKGIGGLPPELANALGIVQIEPHE